MKNLFYIALIGLFVAGCTSSANKEEQNQKALTLKRQIDSLKTVHNNNMNTLDSLEKVNADKNARLNDLKLQLDSLNKIMNQEGK